MVKDKVIQMDNGKSYYVLEEIEYQGKKYILTLECDLEKDMVNEDIKNNYDDYKDYVATPDPNIDFRRVGPLKVFFSKYAQSLTTNPEEIASWQPGDIVIFRNTKHIGIISDKRNKNGITYVIHNSGQPNREEDYLLKNEITGHYRFDASLISDEVLKPWND